MVMDFLFSILIYALVIGLVLALVMEIFNPFRGAMKRKGFLSKDAGDRLRVYLIRAGKLNPQNCKVLKLRRTKYNNGGKIGKIAGCIPSRFVTRFIIKRHILSGRQIIYVPVDMHSSLLCKDVVLDSLGLENSGGFYYPHPYDNTLKKKIFDLFKTALNIDLHNHFITDLLVASPTQVEKSISGDEYVERVIRQVPEEYKEVEEE